MEQVKRKVTYRIYPSTKQANKMVEIMRLHQRLYNAALEQRIDAYRRCDKSLNYYDQAKELTQLRAEFPEYGALNAQSEQVTLRRLEKAGLIYPLSTREMFFLVAHGAEAPFVLAGISSHFDDIDGPLDAEAHIQAMTDLIMRGITR